MTLIFGEKPFMGFCKICGRELLLDGGCEKYHKIGIKAPKREKEVHGKSKSPARFYNYEQSEKGINSSIGQASDN